LNSTLSGFEVVCLASTLALVLHVIRIIDEERGMANERDEANEQEGPVDDETEEE
jgi:hypothetical protein